MKDWLRPQYCTAIDIEMYTVLLSRFTSCTHALLSCWAVNTSVFFRRFGGTARFRSLLEARCKGLDPCETRDRQELLVDGPETHAIQATSHSTGNKKSGSCWAVASFYPGRQKTFWCEKGQPRTRQTNRKHHLPQFRTFHAGKETTLGAPPSRIRTWHSDTTPSIRFRTDLLQIDHLDTSLSRCFQLYEITLDAVTTLLAASSGAHKTL